MGDEEEYDFAYSDESEQEPDVEVENTYYEAKGLKAENPKKAIAKFAEVIRLERERGSLGEWGFKALKQSIKLFFASGRHEEMLAAYRQLLDDYTGPGVVTQNAAEKGIDSILDHVSSSENWSLLHSLYETTLNRLAARRSDRLYFKTNLKLGHLLRKTGDLTRLQKVIKQLLKCCEEQGPADADHGADAIKRGTQLLEVYALQIQLHSLRRDTRKLKELYTKAIHITWGVPHPRTLAVMAECGGKMYMAEKDYDQATQAFFQSFKSYDEAGDPRRLCVLKYLVLASILHETTIDPFDSQEAKPYKTHPEIVAMCTLVSAFMSKDVKTFEYILKVHRDSIMADDFISSHIGDLLRTVRSQVLLRTVAPYVRVSLAYLARELNNISEEEVESLLVELILDRKIQGGIDQVNRLLVQQGAALSSFRPTSIPSQRPPLTTNSVPAGQISPNQSHTPPSSLVISNASRGVVGGNSCASRTIRDFSAVGRLAEAVYVAASGHGFNRPFG